MPGTLADAVALAGLPESIRGFGHVKRRSMDAVAPQRDSLRQKLELA